MSEQGLQDLGLPVTTELQHEVSERVGTDDWLALQLSDLVRRMHQACTNPRVVQRPGLGALWGLRLRNIDDVLDLMIEQGHTEQINATLLSFQRLITRSSLILQHLEDPNRLLEAQGLLGDVVDDLNDAIDHLVDAAAQAELCGPL